MTDTRKLLARLRPRLVRATERSLKAIPPVRRRLEKEYATLLRGMEPRLKPYRGDVPAQTRIPVAGRSRDDILAELGGLSEREESRWRDGFVSGAVYIGDESHRAFMNEVYALNSQTNPLHSEVWPSITKFEAEIGTGAGQSFGCGGPR